MKAPDLQRLSRLRQDIHRLGAKAARLLRVLLDRRPLIRGTVYELRRKCGKPSCRCVTEGKLHPAMVISWNENGRQRLRALNKTEVAELRRRTSRYRHFRKSRAALINLHAEILALIDEIEKELRENVR
ncbi:MAG: hypothetical protein DDT34_02154 [Firmicutes bacterium]|nr:hypothetical protein [Bacillota bacterium]